MGGGGGRSRDLVSLGHHFCLRVQAAQHPSSRDTHAPTYAPLEECHSTFKIILFHSKPAKAVARLADKPVVMGPRPFSNVQGALEHGVRIFWIPKLHVKLAALHQRFPPVLRWDKHRSVSLLRRRPPERRQHAALLSLGIHTLEGPVLTPRIFMLNEAVCQGTIVKVSKTYTNQPSVPQRHTHHCARKHQTKEKRKKEEIVRSAAISRRHARTCRHQHHHHVARGRQT